MSRKEVEQSNWSQTRYMQRQFMEQKQRAKRQQSGLVQASQLRPQSSNHFKSAKSSGVYISPLHCRWNANILKHIYVTEDNSAGPTSSSIQVLPVVGQINESEKTSDTAALGAMEINNKYGSFSMSPISADISEPETETEEDQESRPYIRQRLKENQRPRPHSTPFGSNSSPPSNASRFRLIAQCGSSIFFHLWFAFFKFSSQFHLLIWILNSMKLNFSLSYLILKWIYAMMLTWFVYWYRN